MAANVVTYTINIGGNATAQINNLTQLTKGLSGAADNMRGKLANISNLISSFNQGFQIIDRISSKMREFTDANQAQQEAEAKLAQVMRNTMGATDGQVQSIKDLAAAQQQLGVIGDEVQLAGAQELGTYLTKTESLKRLMPVMNDMLAQQYGLNASQESAAQIASMMGKVMEGQVGALSRYGYKFDEAQEKILKYGTEAEKVETLAEVIGQSVGGMNEALAATPEGQLKQAANNMGDIKERIGQMWTQLQVKLLPVVQKLIAFTNRIIDAFQQGWPLVVIGVAAILVAVTKVRNRLFSLLPATATASGGFMGMAALAKASCMAIGAAIKSIPIIGWIAAAIGLVIGIFKLLWEKCEGFRAVVSGVWEVIKAVFTTAWGFIKGVAVTIFNIYKTIIGAIVGAIRSAIGWVKGILSKAAAFVARVLAPVRKVFSGLWDFIKGILDKIIAFMGKMFNPIIELWNKITGKTVQKFQTGAEKGRQSFRRDQEKKNAGKAPVAAGLNPGLDGTGTGTVPGAAKQGAEAIATGGTRNTSIVINLGKMVENIIFNGSVADNAAALEQQITETLMRTLYAAEAAAV